MTTVYESIGAVVWFFTALSAFIMGLYALKLGMHRQWPIPRSLALGALGISVYVGMGLMSINL